MIPKNILNSTNHFFSLNETHQYQQKQHLQNFYNLKFN
jgi:hypothetical protein